MSLDRIFKCRAVKWLESSECLLGGNSRRLLGAPTPLSRGQATPASVATLRPIIRNENGHPSNWEISFTVYTVLCYQGVREPRAPAASPAKSSVRSATQAPLAVWVAAGVSATRIKFSALPLDPPWTGSSWIGGEHSVSQGRLLKDSFVEISFKHTLSTSWFCNGLPCTYRS